MQVREHQGVHERTPYLLKDCVVRCFCDRALAPLGGPYLPPRRAGVGLQRPQGASRPAPVNEAVDQSGIEPGHVEVDGVC